MIVSTIWSWTSHVCLVKQTRYMVWLVWSKKFITGNFNILIFIDLFLVCFSRKALTWKYYAKKILYYLRQQKILNNLKAFLQHSDDFESYLEGETFISVWVGSCVVLTSGRVPDGQAREGKPRATGGEGLCSGLWPFKWAALLNLELKSSQNLYLWAEETVF